jgi:hypothetical protein
MVIWKFKNRKSNLETQSIKLSEPVGKNCTQQRFLTVKDASSIIKYFHKRHFYRLIERKEINLLNSSARKH